MTFDVANIIFNQINSSKLESLKYNLIESCISYSRIRVDWLRADNEKRIELDNTRKITHNALIDACNILSRNMIKNGEDAIWRLKLGNNRKVIGDFACYLNCILGLSAG